MCVAGRQEGHKLLCSPAAASQHLHVLATRKCSRPCSSGVFFCLFVCLMEDSIHKHDWLNHWPLVIDSNSTSSLFLRGQREGLKVLTLLVTWLVPLATSSHPLVTKEFSKNHFIKINSGMLENKRLAFHLCYSGAISGNGIKD